MDKPLQGLLKCKTPAHLCFHWLWLWLLDPWGSFPSARTLALLGCPARAPRLNEEVSYTSFCSRYSELAVIGNGALGSKTNNGDWPFLLLFCLSTAAQLFKDVK